MNAEGISGSAAHANRRKNEKEQTDEHKHRSKRGTTHSDEECAIST
jgi:hypothetical protein